MIQRQDLISHGIQCKKCDLFKRKNIILTENETEKKAQGIQLSLKAFA